MKKHFLTFISTTSILTNIYGVSFLDYYEGLRSIGSSTNLINAAENYSINLTRKNNYNELYNKLNDADSLISAILNFENGKKNNNKTYSIRKKPLTSAEHESLRNTLIRCGKIKKMGISNYELNYEKILGSESLLSILGLKKYLKDKNISIEKISTHQEIALEYIYIGLSTDEKSYKTGFIIDENNKKLKSNNEGLNYYIKNFSKKVAKNNFFLDLADKTNINEIDLSNLKISIDDLKDILNYVCKNDSITKIDLSETPLQYRHCSSLYNSLRNNKTIKELNISGTRISKTSIKKISKLIENNKYIKKIDLSYNEFDESSAEVISDAISKNETLEEIDFSYNKLNKDYIKSFVKKFQNNTSIKDLNFEGNNIGDYGIKIFAKSLKNNKLKEINFSNNGITDLSINQICKIIEELKISKLNILENEITNNGIEELIKTIKEKKLTSSIDISVYDDKKKTTKYQGTIINELNKTISENISHKYIESNLKDKISKYKLETILAFANSSNTYEKIDLSSYKINDSLLIHISNIIKSNFSLKKINLSNNNITVNGAIKLLSSISNEKLKELDLSNNKEIGDGIITEISELLKTGNLKKINLSNTNLSYSFIKELYNLIKRNKLNVEINLSGTPGLDYVSKFI